MQNPNNRSELAVIMPDEWQVLTAQASALVASGFLPQSVNNTQKAVAIMTLGRELGIGAWAALTSINVIQGKPTISPQLMLALISRSGQLEDIIIDSEAERCVVTMKRKGRTSHTETFWMADAQSMQLIGKDNWKKQPRIMMKWRAVAACARVVFADVILGMYTPEEMGANVDADDQGNMTVISVSTPPESPRQPQLTGPQSDTVTVAKSSAKVSGAGLPALKPTDNFDDEFPPFGIEPQQQENTDMRQRPDETEHDPNLYHCDRLIVTSVRSVKTYKVTVVKSGTAIPLSLEQVATLEYNGQRIGDLEPTIYPLEPAWSVYADRANDGVWVVSDIVTNIPVTT